MKRMYGAIVILVVVLVGCSTAPRSYHAESGALWRHYETLEALMAASDLVVRARITDAQRAYSAGPINARNLALYFTDTTVRVERFLKGEGPGELTVWQHGKAGDPRASFADLPVLRPGT